MHWTSGLVVPIVCVTGLIGLALLVFGYHILSEAVEDDEHPLVDFLPTNQWFDWLSPLFAGWKVEPQGRNLFLLGAAVLGLAVLGGMAWLKWLA